MAIDPETARPRLSFGTGGLSGPAIKPIAVRMVYQVARALPGMPLIGIGGIESLDDVLEFLPPARRRCRSERRTSAIPAFRRAWWTELAAYCAARARHRTRLVGRALAPAAPALDAGAEG